MVHQFIQREPFGFKDENFFGNNTIRFIYSRLREHAPVLFNTLISPRIVHWMSHFIFDSSWGSRISGSQKWLASLGIDLTECLDDPSSFTSVRKLFERKIRYWETRPMPNAQKMLVSPSDARVLVGSLTETPGLNVKEKFFSFEELFGRGERNWSSCFKDGDFAIFRLTPEKYH